MVISTDTAFLVGALALIGPRVPGRLRVFLLALAVVDDIGALSIIALVQNFNPLPLVVAAVGLVGVYFTRYLRAGRGPVYATLAVIVWLAFLASGVHPTLAGVAIALLVPVYRPNRRDVEHALRTRAHVPAVAQHRVRTRRGQQPARVDLDQRAPAVRLCPYVRRTSSFPSSRSRTRGSWISPEILAGAVRSPLTWGIVVGLVVGKLVGVFGSAAVLRLLRLGDFGPGLTLDRILGGAALCGIGFTISLFIVDLAIQSPIAKNEARVGVLAASVIAFVLATILFRISDAVRPGTESGLTSDASHRSLSRPPLRQPRRPVHDRGVRRLPVRILPQGIGLDPGGARGARRQAALHLAARTAGGLPPERAGWSERPPRRQRCRAGSSSSSAACSPTRRTRGPPTSSASRAIWDWTSTDSRGT